MDEAKAVQIETRVPTSGPAIINVHQARIFAIREVRDYTQRLVGGILTILDAAVTDQKQSAAIRKLIMRECWEAHYQQALTWAEKECVIEQEQGIEVQEWNDIDVHRSMHPTVVELFNPFPFSTTTLPVSTSRLD